MRNFAKKLTAIFVLSAVTLSCICVFAEDQKVPTYTEIIESTAENISVFGRYDGLFEDSLYIKILEELKESIDD